MFTKRTIAFRIEPFSLAYKASATVLSLRNKPDGKRATATAATKILLPTYPGSANTAPTSITLTHHLTQVSALAASMHDSYNTEAHTSNPPASLTLDNHANHATS